MPKKISHKQKSRKHSGRRTKKYTRKQKGGKPTFKAVAAALRGLGLGRTKTLKNQPSHEPMYELLTTPGTEPHYVNIGNYIVPLKTDSLYQEKTFPTTAPQTAPQTAVRQTRHTTTKTPETKPTPDEALKQEYNQLMMQIDAQRIVQQYRPNRPSTHDKLQTLLSRQFELEEKARTKGITLKQKPVETENPELNALYKTVSAAREASGGPALKLLAQQSSNRPRMPLPHEVQSFKPASANIKNSGIYITVNSEPLYRNVPNPGAAQGAVNTESLYKPYPGTTSVEQLYRNVPNPGAAQGAVNTESLYKPYPGTTSVEQLYRNVPNPGAAQGAVNTESLYKPYPGTASVEPVYKSPKSIEVRAIQPIPTNEPTLPPKQAHYGVSSSVKRMMSAPATSSTPPSRVLSLSSLPRTPQPVPPPRPKSKKPPLPSNIHTPHHTTHHQ